MNDIYQGHIEFKGSLRINHDLSDKYYCNDDLKIKKITLNKIMKRFDETNSNTIPVNDMGSIHLYNKDGNPDVGYNIQTAVDNESKMFIALIVSHKATDHHQFSS